MENLSPFCSCRDKKCPLNPVNHEHGCSLCIQKCLKVREIPSCFFNLVGGVDRVSSYYFEDFAKAVADWNQEHPNE